MWTFSAEISACLSSRKRGPSPEIATSLAPDNCNLGALSFTGVKEIEATLAILGTAGDRFDLATLFLQLCLVIGAIGLIMKQLTMKRVFLGGLVGLGLIGATFTVLGYHQVGLF